MFWKDIMKMIKLSLNNACCSNNRQKDIAFFTFTDSSELTFEVFLKFSKACFNRVSRKLHFADIQGKSYLKLIQKYEYHF